MKQKADLQSTFFVLIVLSILILLIYLRYDLNQLKSFVNTVSSDMKESSQLTFMKDLMDRNVKVYSTVTTSVVAIVIFAFGIYLNMRIERSSLELETSFKGFRDKIDSKLAEIDLIKGEVDENVSRLSDELYYNTAVIFHSVSSNTHLFQDPNLLFHLYYQSIYGYVRSYKSLNEDKQARVKTSISHQVSKLTKKMQSLIDQNIENPEIPKVRKNGFDPVQGRFILDNAPDDIHGDLAALIVLINSIPE